MPLWDGIATALNREVADLQGYLSDRIVEDSLGATALRTVLLCESPHHAEISHGHPLAGDSGETVTRAFARNHCDFNGREEPIGCLLPHGTRCVNADGQPLPPVNGPVLNSLGLMNVSRLPLDGSAYCIDAHRQCSELLCYFEVIKLKLEKKKRGQGVRFLRNLDDDTHASSQVYTTLRDDLICRLNQLRRNIMVVPCGRVAEAFFGWATENCGCENCVQSYDCFVPHPSRKSWQRSTYRQTIDRLVRTIVERAA